MYYIQYIYIYMCVCGEKLQSIFEIDLQGVNMPPRLWTIECLDISGKQLKLI